MSRTIIVPLKQIFSQNNKDEFAIHEGDCLAVSEILGTQHFEDVHTKRMVRTQEIHGEWRVDRLRLGSESGALSISIGQLTHLVSLDLYQSTITSLPASIGRLKNLEELNLSHTKKLLELPSEIGDLASLSTLDLECSGIKLLPPSIGELKNLKWLGLDNTLNLSKLSTEFGSLTSLNMLTLRHAEFTSVPKEIGNLSSLNHLNLSHTKLTNLPTSVGQLQNLETLWLHGAKNLQSLPHEIGNVTNLSALNLECSGIKSLPASIGNLKNLKELHLNEAKTLSDLPNEIGNLSSLITLDLTETSIRMLPSSIGQLKKLKQLWLGYTKNLLCLPEEIGSISNMDSLHLQSSAITSLPTSIGNLISLRTLELGQTGISFWPDSCKKLSNLMHLSIDGTPTLKVQENDCFDTAMMLVKSHPSLGCLEADSDSLSRDQKKELSFALACNRSGQRLRSLMNEKADGETISKLWPMILKNASRSFGKYPTPEGYKWFAKNSPPCEMKTVDALHGNLLNGRELFIQLLVDHKSRSPVARKVYFSHANIQGVIVKLLPKIKAFAPAAIIAIEGGGYLMQTLRKQLRIPVLLVSLEINTNTASTNHPCVEKLQWFDEQSKVGKMASEQKVLIVAEVDDTCAIIQYCVEQVTQTNPASNVAVAVLHNKCKPKCGGKLPKGVAYMAGAEVEDHWECHYPWDAVFHGNTHLEHEALAEKCHFDW